MPILPTASVGSVFTACDLGVGALAVLLAAALGSLFTAFAANLPEEVAGLAVLTIASKRVLLKWSTREPVPLSTLGTDGHCRPEYVWALKEWPPCVAGGHSYT